MLRNCVSPSGLPLRERHMSRVQNIATRSVVELLASMSVCQPWRASLAPICFQVLLHVGQDRRLGMIGLVVGVGDVDLQFAEAAAKGGELRHCPRVWRGKRRAPPSRPSARRMEQNSLSYLSPKP